MPMTWIHDLSTLTLSLFFPLHSKYHSHSSEIMPGSSRGSQLCPFIRLPLWWEPNYSTINSSEGVCCVWLNSASSFINHAFIKFILSLYVNVKSVESSVQHTTELLGLFAAGTRFSWHRGWNSLARLPSSFSCRPYPAGRQPVLVRPLVF